MIINSNVLEAGGGKFSTTCKRQCFIMSCAMIFKLNPNFSIRNEDSCSYLIKRDGTATSLEEENFPSVTPLPPAIGYILGNIAQCDYEQSLKRLASELAVNQNILDLFLKKLMQDSPQQLNYGECKIVFPKNLLVYSNEPLETACSRSENYSSSELRYRRPLNPINMNVMVTTKCKTNCLYCYARRHFNYEMTTKEIAALIEECRKIGVVNLSLTGGDIFARKDWRNILQVARKYKYSPFLSTKTPLKEDDVSYLSSIGISQLQFSLDAHDNHILTQLIGVNDNYLERVKCMFDYCEENKIKICVRTVLCRQNADVDKVSELYHFISRYTNIKDWVLTPAFFSDNNTQTYQQLQVSKEKLVAVRTYINDLKAQFPIYLSKISPYGYKLKLYPTTEEYVAHNQKCYANTYSMSVLATGDCTVCEMLYDNKEYLLGNVREQSLHDIWNSPKALALFSLKQQDIPKASPCHECSVFEVCRNKLAKRVCYVDIAKMNHQNSLGYPDPRCPMAKDVDVIL